VLTPRIRSALVILAASAGLAGCTTLGPYGGVGVGVGSGYGSYGGYGYDPYYAGYGYGSGYGYNPYGWYNGYYYPGSGYWVYDRDKNRRPLTAAERAYWNERIKERMRERRGLNGATSTAAVKENWTGFDRPTNTTTTATGTVDRNQARAQMRQRALEQRAQRQQVQSESRQVRSERQEAREQAASERRESRRARQSTDD
jgi:hypothetical protein